MKSKGKGGFDSPRSGPYEVFGEPEDVEVDQVRQIRFLVNAWLKSRDRTSPNVQSVRLHERKVHNAIKSSPLYGKILSFAGLNLWVDDRTSDGDVMIQECINL